MPKKDSKIGDAVDSHCARMEFGADGDRIFVADARRLGGGFAVEDYAIGVRIERRWDPLESTCRHASLSIL